MEKISCIEKKISEGYEEDSYALFHIIEVILVLSLVTVFIGTIFIVSNQVRNMESKVLQDAWSLRLTSIINSRAILTNQVLHTLQYPGFSNNMCEAIGIPNMTNYLEKILSADIFTSFKPFFDRFNSGKMDQLLINYILDKKYKKDGIRWSGNIGKITYVKMVNLLRQLQANDIQTGQYKRHSISVLLSYYHSFY